MKKILALLLALSMLFVLTACREDNKNTPTGESTGSAESTNNATDGMEDTTQGTTESTTDGDTTEFTDPTPTEPKPTEPKPTEPKPTEPEENNSQNQQAEYERALDEINTEYDRVVAEIQEEHYDNLLNLAAAKLEAESQIGALRAAYLSESNSLSNQKSALIREKDQALANALATTGGYYNSYYDTLKKQYDSRIAAIDNQIAQTNSKYNKQISEWQTYLDNLPTVADYEYLRDIELQDVEKWKNEQIEDAKNYYGIA